MENLVPCFFQFLEPVCIPRLMTFSDSIYLNIFFYLLEREQERASTVQGHVWEGADMWGEGGKGENLKKTPH